MQATSNTAEAVMLLGTSAKRFAMVLRVTALDAATVSSVDYAAEWLRTRQWGAYQTGKKLSECSRDFNSVSFTAFVSYET